MPHDVTISYEGSTIAYLDASGTEVLETDGTICSDDITIEYVKPSAPSPNLQAKTNISPSTSSQTITPDVGYDGLSSVQINAMPQGSATTPATSITANPTITASGGNISANVSTSQNITPTVSAGYVSSGTAGTATVSGSASVAATTLDANLVAGNIKKDVSIFGVTGAYEGGGGATPVTFAIYDSMAIGIVCYIDSSGTYHNEMMEPPMSPGAPSVSGTSIEGAMVAVFTGTQVSNYTNMTLLENISLGSRALYRYCQLFKVTAS